MGVNPVFTHSWLVGVFMMAPPIKYKPLTALYSPREHALWKWNLCCALAHTVQAVIALIISLASTRNRYFTLPLQTSYLTWLSTNGTVVGGVTAVETIARLHFSAAATSFEFVSALAHIGILIAFPHYIAQLRRGINRFRWLEYAISSSIMMALIAMLVGVYDIWLLVLIVTANAGMIANGDLLEVVNEKQSGAVNWLPFYYGSFLGLVPWVLVFTYVGAAGTVPVFVWAILASYMAFFCTFPINMYLQYKQVWWFSDKRWGFTCRCSN